MWRTVKLGDVSEVKAGNSAPQDDALFDNGLYPFVRTSDVGAIKVGRLNSARDYLNDNGIKKLKLFKKGTVLFPKSGASTFLNHRVILTMDAYVSSHLATIKADNEYLLDEYVWYYLQTIDAAQLVADSAYPSLQAQTIKEIAIPLPPLAEQQRIVAKLDAAFAEIDEAIKFNVQKYDELDNLFNSYMDEKFNSEEFPGIKLSEVCDFIGGSQPPKSVFEYEETASNIRLIQIRDYKSDNHIVYIPKDKARRFCSKSDVMIGRYGPPIFQILRGIEGSYNVALMKAVPKDTILNDYLFYFLKNPKIQNFVIKQSIRAAGQSGVNKDALEPYQMHLPSISHQKEIVKKVTQFEANILEVKNIYQAKLENLHVLKSAMLAKELQSEAA